MEEQLISFETAKLAHEKGFFYKGMMYRKGGTLSDGKGFMSNLDLYSAPTQSILQKWLRERKSPIVVEVNFGVIDDSESAYTWHIREYQHEGVEGTRKKNETDFWENYDSFISVSGNWFGTYEEALEKGLLRALKLIKQP